MHDQILKDLGDLESQHDVRVLYAVESGSRAWGFASPDSDWDVRFIYMHPRDWYLSVESQRDVIEAMLPNDIDLAGWDLRKTLGLLRKSNPSLIEWLHSPIVYSQDSGFVQRFRDLAERCLSAERLMHHYLSMAGGNFRTYLQDGEVSHKKYLYVLRPILACRWLERFDTAPPVPFDALVEACLDEAPARDALKELLAIKAISSESAKGAPIPELHSLIASELERLDKVRLPMKEPMPASELNDFFRGELSDLL